MNNELTFILFFCSFLVMAFGAGIVIGEEFILNGFYFMLTGFGLALLGAYFNHKSVKEKKKNAKSKSI